MRNGSWIEEFACELRGRGLTAAQIASLVVEAQSYLEDSATSAIDSFGAPATYAADVAAAIAPDPVAAPSAGPVRIHVDGVTLTRRGRTVLDPVAMQVRGGEVVALIGPNGCGKSTLLRVIAGITRADRGQVAVHGAVGYTPQHGGLSPFLTPQDHFVLFGAPRGLSASDSAQEGRRLAAGLGWETNGAPIARDLSGGTRQKLSIVLAMLGRPEILLLDEPYQGLDLTSTQRFWESLWDWGERGGAAVVVSHTHDALSRATRVIELTVPAR